MELEDINIGIYSCKMDINVGPEIGTGGEVCNGDAINSWGIA